MQRSKLPYFFLALAAVIAAGAIAILVLRPGVTPGPPPNSNGGISDLPKQPPMQIDPAEKTTPPAIPGKPTKEPGSKVSSSDPADLVNQIGAALEAGDLAALSQLMGDEAIDAATADRLKELFKKPIKLRKPNGIREVGELELNVRTRWALELDDEEPGRDRIFLDLKRDGQKWIIEKITLPTDAQASSPQAMPADSLTVADAFLQAVLKQNFELARALVDTKTVSDAKIAGLCILFEEGEYRMRASKPLRAMFQRADTAGYLANVETTDGKQTAQFSITLKLPPAPAGWLISEINLDQLLAEYARRVAGGDAYYSPLVKNPSGGDTLALYFEFDEDQINPRTRRQLEIVAMILRADPGKKLTLSGHTDALGTDDYNISLSSRRADVVRDVLTQAGVSASQIVTVAKGASQPRRPNLTETGLDNPEGRRANRRTEIYLDF